MKMPKGKCNHVVGYHMPTKLKMDKEVGTPILCGNNTKGRKICDEHVAWRSFKLSAVPVHEIPNLQKTLDGRYVTEYTRDTGKWRWKGTGRDRLAAY